MSAFLGMRGTGDWVTDQRPTNFRETMLYLYPNGALPLTAILSKMKSEVTDDPKISWWEKELPTQVATITGRYTDVGLSSAYVSGGAIGTTLYFKMSEAHSSYFRVGHIVMLRYTSDLTLDCRGKVTACVQNGASSYIAVKLLEADDNSSTYYLASADRALIIGNSNSEGADVPNSVAYDPTSYYNYTQIFRTPYEITGTAENTTLRTGSQDAENKRESLEIHGMEMEKAFLWGIRTENVGSNGKKERTTMGLIPAINAYSDPDNIACYTTDTITEASGKTWVQGGDDWLNYRLAKIFRWGSTEKMGLCGYQTLLAINQLAKLYGNIQLQPAAKSYGIQVVEWTTPFGMIYLKTHPLFSYEDSNSRTLVVFEPNKLIYSPMKNRDTKLLKNRQSPGVDGRIDEYMTECALQFPQMKTAGYLTGFGTNNT